MDSANSPPNLEFKELPKKATPDPLNVYCLPVSGGGFVAQLGLLSEIYLAKKIAAQGVFNGSKDYEPDLIFAASGGNVAAYVALGGDWSPDGIERVAAQIETQMFIRSWLPPTLSFIPSWIFGSFHGSMYREGYGSASLFRSLFTSDTVKRVEIWTGTYDKDHRKAQFFCNLNPGGSMVNSDHFQDTESLFGAMSLKYLSGDLDKIASVVIASASIPLLVNMQSLDGVAYSDGGSMYASPITAMASEVYRIVTGHIPPVHQIEVKETADGTIDFDLVPPPVSDSVFCVHGSLGIVEPAVLAPKRRALRLLYISSYQMEATKGSASSIRGRSFGPILHANVIQDRGSAVNILYRICGDDATKIRYFNIHNMTTKKLGSLLVKLNTYLHYVVGLYPHGSPTVPLTKFCSIDVLLKIRETRNAYGAHIWYYPVPLT